MAEPDWKLIAVQRGIDLDALKQALSQIAFAPKDRNAEVALRECIEIANEALGAGVGGAR